MTRPPLIARSQRFDSTPDDGKHVLRLCPACHGAVERDAGERGLGPDSDDYLCATEHHPAQFTPTLRIHLMGSAEGS